MVLYEHHFHPERGVQTTRREKDSALYRHAGLKLRRMLDLSQRMDRQVIGLWPPQCRPHGHILFRKIAENPVFLHAVGGSRFDKMIKEDTLQTRIP